MNSEQIAKARTAVMETVIDDAGAVQIRDVVLRVLDVLAERADGEHAPLTYGQWAGMVGDGPCLRCIGRAVMPPHLNEAE